MALGPTHSLSNLSLLPWMFGLSGHVKAVLNIRSVFPTLLVNASVPGRAGDLY